MEKKNIRYFALCTRDSDPKILFTESLDKS